MKCSFTWRKCGHTHFSFSSSCHHVAMSLKSLTWVRSMSYCHLPRLVKLNYSEPNYLDTLYGCLVSVAEKSTNLFIQNKEVTINYWITPHYGKFTWQLESMQGKINQLPLNRREWEQAIVELYSLSNYFTLSVSVCNLVWLASQLGDRKNANQYLKLWSTL